MAMATTHGEARDVLRRVVDAPTTEAAMLIAAPYGISEDAAMAARGDTTVELCKEAPGYRVVKVNRHKQ